MGKPIPIKIFPIVSRLIIYSKQMRRRWNENERTTRRSDADYL